LGLSGFIGNFVGAPKEEFISRGKETQTPKRDVIVKKRRI
jgi:hypothetical protein